MQRVLGKSQKRRSEVRPFVLGLVLIGLLGFSGCSDLQDHPDAPSGPAAQAHPEGWIDPAAKQNFHGQAIRSQGWDMSACQSCHGEDYTGGAAKEPSCLVCHADTPEGCNVCHGSNSSIAPPEDTRGNVETRFAGVGAHQAHLDEGAIALALDCVECHLMPQSFADPAHIDGDERAEIVWGERATTGGVVPEYDSESFSCASTYCHSGGKFGSNPPVAWTEVGSGQADCGTCHGLPPDDEATDHPQVSQGLTCATCHGSVVDEDLNIVDKSLHMNGKTDF